MRKDFEDDMIVTPLPVLMIATYDEEGRPDVMPCAWGGQCGAHQVAVNLGSHQTTENIKARKAFTLSFATKNTAKISDYFGVVSAKDMPDKVEKSGVHVFKSTYVDAPVIDEYPLTLECTLADMQEEGEDVRFVGNVVNMSADYSILDYNGFIDLSRLQPLVFDSSTSSYHVVGDKVGEAFRDGFEFKLQLEGFR